MAYVEFRSCSASCGFCCVKEQAHTYPLFSLSLFDTHTKAFQTLHLSLQNPEPTIFFPLPFPSSHSSHSSAVQQSTQGALQHISACAA